MRTTSAIKALAKSRGSLSVGGARWGQDVKTLGQAFREFRSKRSPKFLATGIAIALAARIAVGEFSWRDIAAVAAMLVIYPFGEWAIHVYLLHMPPFEL